MSQNKKITMTKNALRQKLYREREKIWKELHQSLEGFAAIAYRPNCTIETIRKELEPWK